MPGKQGFASMSKERLRALASEAGKLAQRSGRAHRWTSATARAASLKGRKARQRRSGGG